MNNLISNCCSSSVEGIDGHYVCLECGEPCDAEEDEDVHTTYNEHLMSLDY